MTKAQAKERDSAIVQLRTWIKPGDTVYTVLDHVSRSGMSRQIRVVLMHADPVTGEVSTTHPNWAVGKALQMSHAKHNGREQDALVVGGCGMDMGFHLVNSLSYVLYGDGYACLGKGKCPSNYHANHRATIRCPGADGRFCWRPNRALFGPEVKVPDNWPRGCDCMDCAVCHDLRVICAQCLMCTRCHAHAAGCPGCNGPLLACLTGSDDGGATPIVCPTCKGAGELPNPEGPERFDLVHTDGYAIRQRWL